MQTHSSRLNASRLCAGAAVFTLILFSGALLAQAVTASRAAALAELLSLAKTHDIAEKDVTKAIVEGRLNPVFEGLNLAWESLGDTGQLQIDVTKANLEWARRFGRMIDLGPMDTIVAGKPRTRTGRDLAARYAVRAEANNERVRGAPSGAVNYLSLDIGNGWAEVTYADLQKQFSTDPAAMASIDAAIEKWAPQVTARGYFIDFLAERDYRDLRETRFLTAVPGANPRALTPRLTEEELNADRRAWSYTHGKGFQISKYRTISEDVGEAQTRGRRLDQLAPGQADEWQAYREDPRNMPYAEAVGLRFDKARRRTVLAALATIPVTWTQQQLVSSDAAKTGDSEGVISVTLNGAFQPLLGARPSGPSGLRRRERGGLIDQAFFAYHMAYGRACEGQGSVGWMRKAWQFEINRQSVGKPIEIFVRFPYEDTVEDIFEERRQSGFNGMGDESREARDRRISDFGAFIAAHGCLSPIVLQFEVNLALLAEGFPPLQELLPPR